MTEFEIGEAGHTQRIAPHDTFPIVEERRSYLDGFLVVPTLKVDTSAVKVEHREIVFVTLLSKEVFRLINFGFGLVVVVTVNEDSRADVRQVGVGKPAFV